MPVIRIALLPAFIGSISLAVFSLSTATLAQPQIMKAPVTTSARLTGATARVNKEAALRQALSTAEAQSDESAAVAVLKRSGLTDARSVKFTSKSGPVNSAKCRNKIWKIVDLGNGQYEVYWMMECR